MGQLKNYLGVLALTVLAVGCGVRAQTYVMDKPRVGIENSGGNAGYLKGSPQYLTPQKKTRKVYILELTKAIPESQVKKIREERTTETHETVVSQAAPVAEEGNAGVVSQPAEPNKPLVIAPAESAPGAPAAVSAEAQGPKESVTYTVQKDDTLQKIAKKFYGSFGKWTKIYEANKEKLKNPNFVKPGTVLTIPAGN